MTSTMDSRWHHKLVEQYLNTFFRETGLDIHRHLVSYQDNPYADQLAMSDGELGFAYHFTASDTVLYGTISHLSLTGYHRYGATFLLQQNGAGMAETLGEIRPLLRLICAQLALNAGQEPEHRQQAANLYEKMCNSVEKSGFFLNARKEKVAALSVTEDFTAAEQGMLLGHPFHVTSKASLGFSEEDMKRYSPELGASFRLHYFAVAPELVRTLSSGADVSQLLDPAARQEAARLLGARAGRYQLIPCHPWQANFLLAQPAVRQQLEQELIISLGPLGQVVWPTSSVRTVWMPESRLFLKLSLDVRITNFIRNNPPEQMIRAIDASRLLNQLTPEETDDALCLLPELAAQTLELAGLEAAFGIIYRAGLEDEALEQTRVLGSLVEECPMTGALPLGHYVRQAAELAGKDITASFVADWWRQYSEVSLLPALTLFATTGISLEAHLQNSLMRFRQGAPVQLVVRDMEGVSVASDSILAQRGTAVGPESSVWYSADEAWFRFKYYLVVNHIAHLIGALARTFPVSEARLWQTTGQVLADANLGGRAQSYARELLQARYLPAKANMLSTFNGTGETPAWVNIPNPLRSYRYRGLTPLAETDDVTAYRQAEQRVVNQLLEALLYEQALPRRHEQDELLIPVSATLSYRCQARVSDSFARVRIRPGSVQRWESGQAGPVSLRQLMEDIGRIVEADAERWQQFHQELTETLVKHAQTLQHSTVTPLRELPYFEQEARINNGHLYHPSFKSRVGFDLDENKRYGPELSPGFPLVWLAVDRALAHLGVSRSTSLEALYRQHFSSEEYGAIHRQIRAAGNQPEDMVLLAVHPWQWCKVIRVFYQDMLTRARIIKLDVTGPDYLPQQSIRTLSDISDLGAPSLKLAMSLLNTSTSRVLAPHTVSNAARISDWLWHLVQTDDRLPEDRKPIILREIAGIGVTPPAPLQKQYGALACIWRESIYRHLSERQSATPVTALVQLDIDRRPLIDPWIRQYGIGAWLTALLERVYLPVMHMLWYHGTALESHAQNMLLVHEQGMPVRVALKDFHDGVRYSKSLLRDAAQLPALTDAPQAHARVNPNSFLETDDANELRDFTQDALCFVNLAELAWFLAQHYHFAEQEFWVLARRVVRQYQSDHPDLAPRFRLFDFFADRIDVEQLASRRFLPEVRLRVMPVANPLREEEHHHGH